MKMSDILARVRYLIDDPSYPTTPELVDLINIGRQEIAKDALCIESEHYYGTSLIPEDQVIAMSGDVFKIQTINYMDNRPNPLEPVTVRDLNATRVQSKQTKPYWYLEENRNITLLPYMDEDYKSSQVALSGNITANQTSINIINRFDYGTEQLTFDTIVSNPVSGDLSGNVTWPLGQTALASFTNDYDVLTEQAVDSVDINFTATVSFTPTIAEPLAPEFFNFTEIYVSNDNVNWTRLVRDVTSPIYTTVLPATSTVHNIALNFSLNTRAPYTKYRYYRTVLEFYMQQPGTQLSATGELLIEDFVMRLNGNAILENVSDLPVDGYIRIGNEDIRYFGNDASTDSVTATLSPVMRGYNGTTAVSGSALTPVYEMDTIVKFYELPPALSYTTLSGNIVTNDDIEPVFATNPDALTFYVAWQAKIKDLDDVSQAVQYQEQNFHGMYLEHLAKIKTNAFVSRDTPRGIRIL